ncbi:MAG TPA: hypothetical protein DHS57_03675 [Erysipelotrichaceae bacterium]|nr:hypothetical protein [Erysipelotrichaceae bacterium]
MNKYQRALEDLRKLERAYNFKNMGQVAPQVNCDVLQKLVDKATQEKAIEEKGLMERRYYYPVCKRK